MNEAEGYSGTMYFHNFITDKGTVATFEKASDLFERAQAGAEAYITTLALVRGGRTSVKQIAKTVFRPTRLALRNRTLLVSLADTGELDLTVFDIQGHHLATLHNGSLAGEMHPFTLINLANEICIIRTVGFFWTMNRQITLKY